MRKRFRWTALWMMAVLLVAACSNTGGPSAAAQGLDDGRPRLLLLLRWHGVLEVDHHLVGDQLRRLLELPGRASRYGKTGTPGPHSSRAYVLG